MTSPRLLNLETIEDRLVPAVISVSYLGSAFVVQTNSSSHGETGRASTPTVTRAEVFRVVNDDGSVQYLLRSANWSGNWNLTLVPSSKPAPRTPPSTVEVPYAPNYRADRAASSSEATRTTTQQKSDEISEAVNSAVSVPFNFLDTSVQTATNDGSGSSQQNNRTSQSQPTALPIDTSVSNSPRNLPLVGSLEVIENPMGAVPPPPVENPPNVEAQPKSESAEPALADVIPAVAAQLANTLPLAGLLPFNVTELSDGVHSVLDRVANLDETTWVEEASGLEDYLWITAGALVAGGVVQAAWSRRNQLTDRRVLGLDSVLARWGSPYDGRLGG